LSTRDKSISRPAERTLAWIGCTLIEVLSAILAYPSRLALAYVGIVTFAATTAIFTRGGCAFVYIYGTVLPLETRNASADVAENTVLAISATSDANGLAWIR
jgi:hypothetical protein